MTAKTRRPLVAAAPPQTVRVERARIWARDAGIMSSLATALKIADQDVERIQRTETLK